MKKIIKQIIILILFLAFLNLSFYFLKALLFSKIAPLNYLFFLLISLLFLTLFYIFLVLTSIEIKWLVLCFLLVIGLSLGWFGISIYTIFGSILFSVFFFLAKMTMQKEESALLKFSFSRISRAGYGLLFTGLGLLISILLFISPKIMGGELTVPKSLFDYFWPFFEKFFATLYPGFSGNLTVDQFLILQMSGVTEKLLEEYSKPETQGRPEGGLSLFFEQKMEIEFQEELQKEIQRQLERERKKIPKEMLIEGRKQIAETFKIDRTLKGDEKMKDIFYEMVKNQIPTIEGPSKIAGVVGLVFTFFLPMKVIFTFLTYPYLLFSLLAFKIFSKIKFFKINKIQVEKEKIVI